MNATLYNIVLDEVSPRLPVLTASLIFVFIAFLAQAFLKRDPLAGVPIVGKGGKGARRKLYQSGGAWDLYEEGYKKVSISVVRERLQREARS
ncbi:ent-kaurene oxidase [Colletotrichum tofieldiae]|uniref:Uncharacterized protein n=1 Tax=Colletotrichum liriopes TaxID=708192 RepID=A0AA37GX61_9PEZI|nr:hypothetical protein ColLi_10551 [Colletotrichum liriopes]GKT79591.1 ent-kaurene oxidase [Colletotrichum tofieldiae]